MTRASAKEIALTLTSTWDRSYVWEVTYRSRHAIDLSTVLFRHSENAHEFASLVLNSTVSRRVVTPLEPGPMCADDYAYMDVAVEPRPVVRA
jgi:hypothetical protein